MTVDTTVPSGPLSKGKTLVRPPRKAPMHRHLSDLRRDIRHTFRGIVRAPGFAAAVILTLGLGIGANAAMFGVVDRLLFRPYPRLAEPSETHRLYLRVSDGRAVRTASHFEYTRLLDLRRWTTRFSEIAAATTRPLAIGDGPETVEERVGIVNANFFTFFDAPPALGRYFTAEEDETPRGADVAVLSHAYWQRTFAGADVRGKLLRIGSQSLEVIGVAPPGFVGIFEAEAPVAWIPITSFAAAQRNARTYYLNYNWRWFEIIGRRKPGVTVDEANADLTAAFQKSWEAELKSSPDLTPIAIAAPSGIAAALRPAAGPEPTLQSRTAVWVSTVSLLVLLIACANVANLMLARALARQRETAVRLALGVTRGRLAREVLTEGLVLSVLGGLVGLLVAQWGGAGIRLLLVGADAARLGSEVLTDPRTLLSSGVIALLTGALTSLVPAIAAGRADVATALKSGAREGTYHRSKTRTALLVTQFALSFVLLAGAGLFVRSLSRVEGKRLGIDYDRIVLVEPSMRGVRLDDSASVRLTQTLLDAAKRYPGVVAAASVTSIPFWSTSSTDLHVPGIDSTDRLGQFTYQVSRGDYFGTTGTRILRGRALSDDDRSGMPMAVVVSESMARTLWPGRDALGECIRVGSDTVPCGTVVGIAEDIAQMTLTDEEHQYYVAAAQYPEDRPYAIYARFSGDPVAQAEGLRRALQALMPGESYVTTLQLADLVRDQQGSWRLGATMFVAFGLLALAVAAVGLSGVIGFNVNQRIHEMGVRLALGADRGHVLGLVLGQSLRFAAVGIGLGGILAMGAAPLIEPLLFEQRPRDPAVLLFVGAVLLLVTLAASLAPALRAVRADPASALRAE